MKVITIDREYGAGGHTVGRQVAERLGIEFYDRYIFKEAAEKSGLDVSQVQEQEESLSKRDRFIRAITPDSFDIKDTVFDYESAVIADLAKKAPCVILGRCANSILDQEGIEHVSVFLHAAEEHRLNRAAQLLGVEDQSRVRRMMRKIDTARRAYYDCYIGGRWDDRGNYDIMLDTHSIPTNVCVDVICAAAQA